MVSLREDLKGEIRPPSGSGLERTGMLDAFVHDTKEDVLVLAMFETRRWEHGDLQLFQLQEKLNAYISFILDGEMKESFPRLAEKPVRVELRTSHEPSRRAMEFLGRARDQLAFQQISLEVVLIGDELQECGGEASGSGCCGTRQGSHKTGEGHVQSEEGSPCCRAGEVLQTGFQSRDHGSCGCH